MREIGAKHWTQISKHLQGRTGKQCRERLDAKDIFIDSTTGLLSLNWIQALGGKLQPVCLITTAVGSIL